MGTIDNQPPRRRVTWGELEDDVEQILTQHEMSHYEAFDLALRFYEHIHRQDDRDVWDEQTKGINDTLREIAAAIGGP